MRIRDSTQSEKDKSKSDRLLINGIVKYSRIFIFFFNLVVYFMDSNLADKVFRDTWSGLVS